MKYPFQKLFLVCTGERCNNEKNGDERGEEIRAVIKDLNKSLGRKRTVRVCAVSCLDLCDHGPNMVVEPDGTTYSHLDRSKGVAVYQGEMGDGPRHPELELDPSELEK